MLHEILLNCVSISPVVVNCCQTKSFSFFFSTESSLSSFSYSSNWKDRMNPTQIEAGVTKINRSYKFFTNLKISAAGIIRTIGNTRFPAQRDFHLPLWYNLPGRRGDIHDKRHRNWIITGAVAFAAANSRSLKLAKVHLWSRDRDGGRPKYVGRDTGEKRGTSRAVKRAGRKVESVEKTKTDLN